MSRPGRRGDQYRRLPCCSLECLKVLQLDDSFERHRRSLAKGNQQCDQADPDRHFMRLEVVTDGRSVQHSDGWFFFRPCQKFRDGWRDDDFGLKIHSTGPPLAELRSRLVTSRDRFYSRNSGRKEPLSPQGSLDNRAAILGTLPGVCRIES